MTTATETKKQKNTSAAPMGEFFGNLFSCRTALKLYHWHITGKGSYAQHIAIDQALEAIGDVHDRLVETSFAKYGESRIVVPETKAPQDIVAYCEDVYDYVEETRKMFSEDFTDSIIDDWQEAMQQLLYRLKRLQ